MVRRTVLIEYALWHAISALRSVSPVKDRDRLRKCAQSVPVDSLTRVETQKAFDDWHDQAVLSVMKLEPELSYGWAARLVNVVLKTLVYVSADYSSEKRPFLHPSIDGMIQDTLVAKGLQKTKASLKDMTRDGYYALVDEYREIAKSEGIIPIEVDHYWSY